jgi:hypothetical protein
MLNYNSIVFMEFSAIYLYILNYIYLGGVFMIKVNNISKEFISSKKYPGFKGAIKGLVIGIIH